MSSTRSRGIAGLSALLAGIGLLVAAKAATSPSTPAQVALPAAPAPTTTAPTTGSGPATSAPPPTKAPTGPHTVDGDVVQTPYGPVQVALVLADGRIVDVRALQTPTDGERSVRLAELATPVLRNEVLSAQSARVDSVSGATYTSDGYAQSVQYALDHPSS